MVKKARKKPRTNRTAFWVIMLLAIGAISVAWWLWSCLYNVSSRFNFILIEKNEQPLKLLTGEVFHLHPQDKLKILRIDTNICFNYGIRLVASGLDVNALVHERLAFSTLLPNKDTIDQYRFRVKVKHHNHDIGYLDLVVEPHVEDWLDKADRIIDGSRRIAVLEKAQQFAPKDNRIRDRLIEAYKSQKRWRQAALMLEMMAKEKPDQKVLYDLIEVYEAMSEREGVISVLRRLIAQNPEEVEVRLRLASALEKAKDLKAAIKEYEDLLKRVDEGDRLPLYKALGYLYTKTNQIKKAISTYLKAVELDKKDVNLYYNLSFLYERRGLKDKADVFLGKAVSLKSEDVESRLKLAERLIEKGKLKEAEKYLSEALKKSPNSARALLLMINIMEKRKDKGKLKQIYRKVLLLDPRNETIIYNLGVLEYETGNLGKSLSYFKKFVKSHPKDAEIHGFLFDIYKRQKKNQLAFKEAQILIKLRPKEIGPYHYVFQYLNSRGNYKKMTEVMKNGLKSHPKNLDLREYLIFAYLKTGKEGLAIAQMNELLKIRPKDVTLLLQLAKLQEKRGKVRQALKTFKKILDISPNHGEAREAYLRLLLQLAKLQEKQGKFKDALEAYKKILDILPDHEEAEEAYLRLRFKVLPVDR